MRILFSYLLSGATFFFIAACTGSPTSVPYPHPQPDSVALPFLNGIVSTEALDFNSAFAPDGQSFYFSRSAKGQWDIYVSKYLNGTWSTPVIASFNNDQYAEADPAFSPDGTLYFISNRPKAGEELPSDFDIWFIRPLGDNQWSQPENFREINSDSSEYYISFGKTGNAYFGSARKGGYGSHDIYVSRLADGKYQTPENLGPGNNSAEAEHDPAVLPDEDIIIFKSENRKDGYGEADLYCSKLVNGKWINAVNLGKAVNTPTYEYCSYISPDQRFFFFSSEAQVKWIGMPFLKKEINRLLK